MNVHGKTLLYRLFIHKNVQKLQKLSSNVLPYMVLLQALSMQFFKNFPFNAGTINSDTVGLDNALCYSALQNSLFIMTFQHFKHLLYRISFP